ncbi:hypothetical protein [Winogradskyella bathintestinalis]|uniref:Uncharacterized protein n=1 Tax=Winogradskyella bathintestinalis TaxID=3035208 RepID=A0ABT7ZXS4_9FLAO|nr:hypothetical protein [Winogradskyella bathintestinalis]MDN3493784.1 hypothetical protein [Winogradskyella bathintestinalis]
MKNEEQKNKTKYNSDITKEDEKILGDKSGNLRQDNGDDEILKKRENQPDFAAKNLDIPGGRNARPLTNNRQPDEENRHHSLGSDHNENLELDLDDTDKG